MNRIEIEKEVEIKNSEVFVDKNSFFKSESTETSAFLKDLYKSLDISYAKFYKMDTLSKLGFLATEILLSGQKETMDENMAIILANTSSSMNTDVNYQHSIKDIPSPALFVYTLPNIVIGEISIRNKIYGEHMFFIQSSYDREFIMNYINELFETGVSNNAIAGWVEVDAEGAYEAHVELCKKTNY